MLCKQQHEAGDAPFAVPLPGSHAAARLQRAAPHPRFHRGCLYRSPRLLELQGQLLLWGTPRAHLALQIWIRGILLRDHRAWCEGEEDPSVPRADAPRPAELCRLHPAEPPHPSPWEDAPKAAPGAEPRARRNDDLRMSWRCWGMPSLEPHHSSLGGIPQEQPPALRHRGCPKQDVGHVE